jgi:hypothetical protein
MLSLTRMRPSGSSIAVCHQRDEVISAPDGQLSDNGS